MRLLDWINNRNRPDSSVASEFDPKTHGHKDWKGVFAEIRHDEALARVRDETGREPSSAAIKKQLTNEPEPDYQEPAPFGSTKKGNPIDIARSEEWRSDSVGMHETRLHIGKSAEGFHGGFQAVPTGGDGEIQWSNARKTEERASLAAQSMSQRWERENAPASLDFENNAIREFERKNAGGLQADRKEPDSMESSKPSPAQSKYAGLFDRPPVTEADAKKLDALCDMALVVQHIARDPDPNVGKYKADFENAVNGIRQSVFQPEKRHERAEKSSTNAAPRGAEKQRDSASPQQGRSGWTWER